MGLRAGLLWERGPERFYSQVSAGRVGRNTVISVSSVALLFIVLAVITALWLKGFVSFGGVMSLYRRIRLAALLWAAVILAIGLLRIFGIAGEGF